jgi:hypothetical protein
LLLDSCGQTNAQKQTSRLIQPNWIQLKARKQNVIDSLVCASRFNAYQEKMRENDKVMI